VVVIDRDALLLARLEAELTRAGMQVETLNTTLGLTPELLALSAPDVVLLDIGLPGLPPDVIPAIFADLRKRRRMRCMIIADGTREEAARHAARLGADAAVSRQSLAAAGARALKEDSTPAALAADPLAEVPDVGAVPARVRGAPSGPSTDILALIEDELAKAPPAPLATGALRFQVALDLFSEHQLYLSKGATLEGGGIFISTALPPPVGSEVVLEITVFRRVKAELKGRVAWATQPRMNNRQPSGAGVVLTDPMPEDLRKALARLLEERRPITWAPRT
jgi:Tfp pilus assembly protein PilZ